MTVSISYVGTVKAFISFDNDVVSCDKYKNKYTSLGDIVAYAEELMNIYGFQTADIIDASTGEILVQMKCWC